MQFTRQLFRIMRSTAVIHKNSIAEKSLCTFSTLPCFPTYFHPQCLWREISAFGSATEFSRPTSLRTLSTSRDLSDAEVKRTIEEISNNFVEAMELLNDAKDSMGTVYFTEDMDEAESAILKVIGDYDALLHVLTADQRRNVTRTIGLKMEELKSQAQMLKESLKDS